MKACSEPSRSGSGCWHATPEPAPREKQAPRLRGECRASIQANKNRYIFWALPFSRLCKHSHGGRWTWHNGAFLDPSVVLFVVGHYTHKVFFLIRIKSFSLKVGSLVSVQDSWRSWGQIHMDLGERRASVKERNKVRKRQKGNPSVLRQFVHRGVCTLAWCPPPPQGSFWKQQGRHPHWKLERNAHSGAPLQTYQIRPSAVEPMNLYFNNLVSWFSCAQI